ncbi:hypothetical protein CBF23_014840 [Marinomonas agarivorans]|nr:hypothetical protein CBF23_014840 [Marinomonas agarivorans]
MISRHLLNHEWCTYYLNLRVLLYAIYWRVGDNLTTEKFLSDYKNELQILLRQIKQALDLLD